MNSGCNKVHSWKARRPILLLLLACVLPEGRVKALQDNLLGKPQPHPRVENRTLLVSTIDGTLHALSLKDGTELWSLKSSKLVSSNLQPSYGEDSSFERIITGVDGSLYYKSSHGLSKFPVTVRQIAEKSPFVTEEGVRYMVSKSNSVFLVSKRSGKVVDMLTMDDKKTDVFKEGECLAESEAEEIVWVAKTEFTVQAIDTGRRRRWNVSFGEGILGTEAGFRDQVDKRYVDYSSFFESNMGSGDIQSGLSSVSSAGPTGNLVVEDMPSIGVSVSGLVSCFGHAPSEMQVGMKTLWQVGLGSPVAAVHMIGSGSDIIKVPHVYLHQGEDMDGNVLALRNNGQEAVYVGESTSGDLYAISNAGTTSTTRELAPFLKKLPQSEATGLEGPKGGNLVPYQPKDANQMQLQILNEAVDSTRLGVVPPSRFDRVWLVAPQLTLPMPEPEYPQNGSGEDDKKIAETKPIPSQPVLIPSGRSSVMVYGALLILMGGPLLMLYTKRVREAERQNMKAEQEKKAKNSSKLNATEEKKNGEAKREENENKPPRARKGKGKKKHHIYLGKMRVFTNQVLGRGSGGTVVYAGLWDKRKVAVKRLLKDAEPAHGSEKEAANVEKEIQLLISSDHLPNIVRYYAKEEDGDFVYLALELCDRTLHQYVTDAKFRHITALRGGTRVGVKPDIPDAELIETVKGVVSGVRQLHELNVVHRDLKPRNILLDTKGKAKIADMGLGKKLSKHRSSFDSKVCGSVGWQPPEMIGIRAGSYGGVSSGGYSGRLTKAVDIFSAGCIVYYVLTRGKHPFGPEPEREYRILRGKADLSDLDHFPLAQELVRSMIGFSPALRITAKDAEMHPLFWDDSKSLGFLQDVSDRVANGNSYALCSMMESKAELVVGKAWDKKLHKELLCDLGKYRKYNFTSVCDCLRVIRNKKNHYLDLPVDAKAVLGSLPSGFLEYFNSRFPRLLIHSYVTIASFYTTKYSESRPPPGRRKDEYEEKYTHVDFETFSRYYSGLSRRRLDVLSAQNRLQPCRGWWPRADIWKMPT